MGKILYLDNGRPSVQVYLVYFQNKSYQAVDVTKLGLEEAEARLPTPKPNYVQQSARNPSEAIALVRDTKAESLLGSPL